jgi:thioredoxin 1
MASEKALSLTDSDFDSTIQGAAIPVLVDFWAEWCAPCRRLSPIVDEVAAEFAGKLMVGKVNVDENPVTPGRFGVRGIPTLILFKGGKVVDQSVGLISKDELTAMVARAQ